MAKTHSNKDINFLVRKLDKESREVLTLAAEHAYSNHHSVLDIPHFLLFLFERDSDPMLNKLKRGGLNLIPIRRAIKEYLGSLGNSNLLPPVLSEQLTELLHDAWIGVCMASESGGLIDNQTIIKALIENIEIFEPMCREIPELANLKTSDGFDQDEITLNHESNSQSSSVKRFTIDLTERAKAGGIDPVIGRDKEISQVIEILLRRRQNNPILTGEAGVGKTAIVEGLAQRIAAKMVPASLQNVRICALDVGLLRAGASMRGEIEQRLKSIIKEITSAEQPVILFIDEAHTIVASGGGAGEQGDIANLIKPELARGSLRTIAATTWAEYKRYFEKDAALSRRFQTVKVEEATVEVSIDILQALIPTLEKHHGVSIMQTAIDAAVRLSSRYIQSRQLPDKAISVLDTACSRAVSALSRPAQEKIRLDAYSDLLRCRVDGWNREIDRTGKGEEGLVRAHQELQNNNDRLSELASIARNTDDESSSSKNNVINVDSEDVASVIADWTGVPSQKMLIDQFLLVSQLESIISQRVVGQLDATHLICNRLRAYTAKLEDPTRPIGVFLLTGPSGVGKTETAHAIADAFFGKAGITVVNMSEYQESHTVSKLKGAPAGYVGYGQGGVLTESIRRQPYGLLLLDEVEKAHPDVLDLFLQVFDKGFMEDSEGTIVDFKNVLVLMTSNAGTEILTEILPKEKESERFSPEVQEKLEAQLLKYFKPAFIGRSQVVPYFSLGQTDLRKIVEIKLKAIADRFNATYRAELIFDSSIYTNLVEKCSAQTIGARWLDQYISEHLLSRISTIVLEKLSVAERVQSVTAYFDDDNRIRVEMADSHVSLCSV